MAKKKDDDLKRMEPLPAAGGAPRSGVDWTQMMSRQMVPRRRVADDILGMLTAEEAKQREYNRLGRQARSAQSRKYAGGALFGSLVSGLLSGSMGGTEAGFMSAMPGVTAAGGFLQSQANQQLTAERRTEGSLNRYLSALIRGATLDTANERNDLMAYNYETDRMKAVNEANQPSEPKKLGDYQGEDGYWYWKMSSGPDVRSDQRGQPKRDPVSDLADLMRIESVKQKAVADLAKVTDEILAKDREAMGFDKPSANEERWLASADPAEKKKGEAAKDERLRKLAQIKREREILEKRMTEIQTRHSGEPYNFKVTGKATKPTAGYSDRVQRGKGYGRR